jgi:hypothetical protein
MPFDKLYIRFLVSIRKPVRFLIPQKRSEAAITAGSGIAGYLWMNRQYYLPFVGSIKVDPYIGEASRKIQEALSDYVSNTSVTVKYIDNQVTVMGEVQRPGCL